MIRVQMQQMSRLASGTNDAGLASSFSSIVCGGADTVILAPTTYHGHQLGKRQKRSGWGAWNELRPLQRLSPSCLESSRAGAVTRPAFF
ncbi:hypothetical protein PAHAL_9G621100 [Panicum hallii]|uniref:Uncharacterized protein n=1 Tax=Panicum hallii TaxID=206008 RepID=A0A2T8I6J6_9POAL|nr:hypothetical protein PAHAL_9G621100 [Panicum hallii]